MQQRQSGQVRPRGPQQQKLSLATAQMEKKKKGWCPGVCTCVVCVHVCRADQGEVKQQEMLLAGRTGGKEDLDREESYMGQEYAGRESHTSWPG